MQNITSNIQTNLHNEFTISTPKGDYKAYNVVLNQAYDFMAQGQTLPCGIVVGRGSGTPVATGTKLFSPYNFKNASYKVEVAEDNTTVIVTLTAEILPEEWAGVTITEIGIGTSTADKTAWTHAMITDKNGQNISITKGPLERWILTAKVYFALNIGATINNLPAHIHIDKAGIVNYLLGMIYPTGSTVAGEFRNTCPDCLACCYGPTQTIEGVALAYYQTRGSSHDYLMTTKVTYTAATRTIKIDIQSLTTHTAEGGAVGSLVVCTIPPLYGYSDITNALFSIPLSNLSGTGDTYTTGQLLGNSDGVQKEYSLGIAVSGPEDIRVQVDGATLATTEYTLKKEKTVLGIPLTTSYDYCQESQNFARLNSREYTYHAMVKYVTKYSTNARVVRPNLCHSIVDITGETARVTKVVIHDPAILPYYNSGNDVFFKGTFITTGGVVHSMHPYTGELKQRITATSIPATQASTRSVFTSSTQGTPHGYLADGSLASYGNTKIIMQDYVIQRLEQYVELADNSMRSAYGQAFCTTANPPWTQVRATGKGFRVDPDTLEIAEVQTVHTGSQIHNMTLIFPGTDIKLICSSSSSTDPAAVFEQMSTGKRITTDFMYYNPGGSYYSGSNLEETKYLAELGGFILASLDRMPYLYKLDFENMTYTREPLRNPAHASRARDFTICPPFTSKGRYYFGPQIYEQNADYYTLVLKQPPAAGSIITYDAIPRAMVKNSQWALNATVEISLSNA